MDEDSLRKLDVVRIVDDYFNQVDWRSKENSNLSPSFCTSLAKLWRCTPLRRCMLRRWLRRTYSVSS
jgi:hypothetical protein